MSAPIEWYNFRWPWVTPNPGFKVTVYLQVEYLNNGATLLQHCRPPGALPKTCKKTLGVVVENFAQEGRKFSCFRTIGRYGATAKAGLAAAELRIGRQRSLAICCRRAVTSNEWHTCTCFNELFVTAHVDDILNYHHSGLVSDVAVPVSARQVVLSCAFLNPDARPRLNGRRSASTVLSQVCLGRPRRRFQFLILTAINSIV